MKRFAAMRAFSFCGWIENLRAVADPGAELADDFRGLARPGEVALPGPVRHHAGDCDARNRHGRRLGEKLLARSERSDRVAVHAQRKDRHAERAQRALVIELRAFRLVAPVLNDSAPVTHQPPRLVAAESQASTWVPRKSAAANRIADRYSQVLARLP